MPSPGPTPTKKGKELFPQHPTEAAQLLARHANQILKKQQQQKKHKQQKTPLQTSRHLSSILAGLK